MEQKKSPAKRSKSDKIVILVGFGIIALAAVVALLIFFVPRWVRESELEERLLRAAAADAESVVLVDLLPQGGNVLTDGAKQILMEGEALQTFREGLVALAEQGCDAAGETTERNLNDLVLRVREADGHLLQIYFGVSRVYYYEGAEAYLFTPDDLTAYSAFYQWLESLVM
ncbi:MAG: hypothetical protein IJY22_03460 [Clostridia bacterium]|nr:hypothetical protein [Clostridia bacterium]